jgi:hypothetical protein
LINYSSHFPVELRYRWVRPADEEVHTAFNTTKLSQATVLLRVLAGR